MKTSLIITIATLLAVCQQAGAQTFTKVPRPTAAAPITVKKDSSIVPKIIPTGYYTLPSRYVSSAITSVPAASIENLLVPNFQTALQGKVAGLQVTQANGQPASDVVMRLRGVSSIYSESQPLYVIDGVPLYTGPREKEVKGVGAGWGSVFNPLVDLDPSDIESVEVLKDAASAAIYGARGGNGVISITTKKSERNKAVTRIDHYQGITSETNRINSLSGPQYLQQLDRAWTNDGRLGQGQLPAFPVISRATAEATNVNNLDQVLEHGKVEQLSVSTSYNSNKTSFFLSGTYRRETGIVTGNDLKRYSTRMNITNQITKRLTIGIKAALSYLTYTSMPVGYAPGGGFSAAQRNLPVYPLYNANGTFFYPLNPAVFNLPGSNVAAFQSKNDWDDDERARRLAVGLNLSFNLATGLDATVEGNMEKYYQTQSNYLSKRLRLASVASGASLAGTPAAYNSYEKYSNDLYNVRAYLTYKKNIKNHRINAVGGFEFIHNENPYFFAEGEGYASESSRQPAAATYKNTVTADALVANTYTFAGYFLNGNYVYKDKYILGATARVDGSSRFGANNKYAFFPAASAGWMLSQEKFFRKIKAINSLKLRASYGETGNSGIGNYSSLERWETNANARYLQQAGLLFSGLGTANLKPERVAQFDLGLDFEILSKRLSGTIDFYNKTTKDLLLSFDAPLSAGLTSPALLLNAGRLRNRGIELSLASRNMIGNFKWTTEFSIAHNTNTVLGLGGLNPQQVSSHTNIRTYEGQPLGTFYLAEYAGVNPTTGEEMIIDKDGNKVVATSAAQIDAARKPQFDKPSAPKFFGGLNNTFSYKNIDLAAMVTFSYGNYILDEGERELSYLTGTNNLRETAANSWTSTNTNTDFPRLKYNDPIAGSNTTRFLHDASYLRMKNITLGYTFKKLVEKVKFLKGARIYIAAQNLFTVTKFPGWDPEVSGNYTTALTRNLNQGVTYMAVPQTRTFAAGFNLNF